VRSAGPDATNQPNSTRPAYVTVTHQTEGVKVPVRHRLATEEDLAKLPTLLIGFGKRLTPEQILENDEDEHEEEE
jgi:hypothetical protein